ncbi:hypothetical protein LIER_23821 [Lithospermum erythrorhizon]|uniref:Uncharacterized protein n=1 Tax=Lithospermum erythrorhizon TaxID=34254 RepID=A0AAV3R201_LITER
MVTGCLYLSGFSRWSHYHVLANLGPKQRTDPGASRSGGVGVGATNSSSPSQQPPLGCCFAGSGFKEGPGGKECC